MPIDIAVDSNRDGTIKFAGNSNDPEVADKPADVTSQDKSFRFWINDDFDVDNKDQERGTPDWQDGLIQCTRDLEDFTRIQIFVGGLREGFESGKFKLGFEWKNTSGSPAVQIYPQIDPSGGDGYLKDQQKADAQIASGVPTGRWSIVAQGGQTLIGTGQAKVFPSLPTSIAGSNFHDKGVINLLFEGCGEGKGQLCITIHDESGNKIGDGPGVWLDLMNVKKMYVRKEGYVVGYVSPYAQDSYQDMKSANRDYDNFTFAVPADEEVKVVVFVHGIHGPAIQIDANIRAGWYATSETVFRCGRKNTFLVPPAP